MLGHILRYLVEKLRMQVLDRIKCELRTGYDTQPRYPRSRILDGLIPTRMRVDFDVLVVDLKAWL